MNALSDSSREAYQSPAEPGQRIALKFGRQKFNLRPTSSPGWANCKVDVPGSLDLCFITEGSLKPIIERWKRLGIPIAAGTLLGTDKRRSVLTEYVGLSATRPLLAALFLWTDKRPGSAQAHKGSDEVVKAYGERRGATTALCRGSSRRIRHH
jgi:hypothetical protein